MSSPPKPYHHGSLRRDVIDRTVEIVSERGIAAVTIRGLAADLGVTHTAVVHHVGSRAGLLSLVAADGFGLLSATLAEEGARDALLDLGVAYVRFAVEHPAHFRVMFRPDALDNDVDVLRENRALAMTHLTGAVGRYGHGPGPSEAVTIAAWGMMHGIAELVLSGSLREAGLLDDPDPGTVLEIARRAGGMLRPDAPPGDAS